MNAVCYERSNQVASLISVLAILKQRARIRFTSRPTRLARLSSIFFRFLSDKRHEAEYVPRSY